MLICPKISYLDSSSSVQATPYNGPRCPLPFATTLLTVLGLVLLSVGAAGVGGTVHLHAISSINMLTAGLTLILLPVIGTILIVRRHSMYPQSAEERLVPQPPRITLSLTSPAKLKKDESPLQLKSPAKLKPMPFSLQLRYMRSYDVGVCYHPTTSLAENDLFKKLCAISGPFLCLERLAKHPIKPTCYSFSVDADTHAFIPSLEVLKAKSGKYLENYDIQIVVVTIAQLPSRLRSLNRQTTKPAYVGLLVSQQVENIWESVTPLLLFFPGDGVLAKVEAIVPNIPPQSEVIPTLKGWGIEHKNLFEGPSLNVLEQNIHMLGALVLLRNALLSIKKFGYEDGFSKPLEKARLEGNKVLHLPPDWDYTSLEKNPLLNEQTVTPKMKSESALEHRKRHERVRTVFCEFIVDKSPKFLSGIQIMPKNFDFYQDESRFKLEFTIPLPVSNYLKRKGKKGYQENS